MEGAVMRAASVANATAQSNSTCVKLMKTSSNGVWQGDNPMDFAFPLLIIQICLVLLVTRTLAFLLKPLRQPRVIAEIIHIFPKKSVNTYIEINISKSPKNGQNNSQPTEAGSASISALDPSGKESI